MAWVLFLPQVSHMTKSRGRQAMFLSGSSEGESTAKLIQVVGRSQFHVVVGLRSHFLVGWLLARAYSQVRGHLSLSSYSAILGQVLTFHLSSLSDPLLPHLSSALLFWCIPE